MPLTPVKPKLSMKRLGPEDDKLSPSPFPMQKKQRVPVKVKEVKEPKTPRSPRTPKTPKAPRTPKTSKAAKDAGFASGESVTRKKGDTIPIPRTWEEATFPDRQIIQVSDNLWHHWMNLY
jgi:hypothetical protein